MKKLVTIAMALIMVLSLAACGGEKVGSDQPEKGQKSLESTQAK